MGTTRDSEATRRAIIDAAGRLFAERGFSGVTAREVAADAGVALSAIPYHFGSMDVLYRETLLIACEISPDAAPLAAQALKEDPDVGLRTAVRWAIVDSTSMKASWPIRLLHREELDPSPAFLDVLRIKIVPEWTWLCQVVARASGRQPGSLEVKFGVIAMYNLAAAFHIRTGMIDHLAPDVLASLTKAPEAFIECVSRLTLSAVADFAATMSPQRPAAPARAQTSAAATSPRRSARSSSRTRSAGS